MIQDLLAELEREVALSKNEIKELNSQVKKANEKLSCLPYFKRIVLDEQKNTTFKKTKGNHFSQAQRFKDPKTRSAAPLEISSAAAEIPSKMPHQKKQQNVIFGQSVRFPEQKTEDIRGSLEVNLNPVCKKSPSIIINPPRLSAKEHYLSKTGDSLNASSVFSDFETQASMSSLVGPGAYDINYSVVEPQRSISLPKSKRFEETKKKLGIDLNPLNPNYDAVKRRAPGVVIKEDVPRSSQLQARDKEQEFYRNMAAANERSKSLDAFKFTRPNPASAFIFKSVMDINVAPKGSRQRIAAVFRFLDQLRELRERGPGAYDIKPPKPAPTMVVYRKNSYSPIRKDPKEDIPGPDYYYCKDDMTKVEKPKWTFAKEEKVKPISLEEQDKRNYNVKYDQILPNPTSAIILPQHQEKFVEDAIQEALIGPGAYEPQFDQVEKRTDIGVIKMPSLNQHNVRENNMDYLEPFEKFDNDLIYPSVDPIKPNTQRGFKYHEPVDQKPPNPPERELFPEKWEFYDYDLNEIRENMTKGGDFSSKMPKDIFAEHEEFMRIMKEYYDRENIAPEIGEYKVNYKLQDKHIPVVDIDKMQHKDVGPIVKPEGDVDGDNLLLGNTSRPQKRLPDIKFSKMLGRIEEGNENDDYGEEIKLDVNYNPVQPKVQVLVDIKRQSERDDVFGAKGGKEEEERPPLDVNYGQQDKKIKGYVEIKKISTREEDPNYNPKPKEQEIKLEVNTAQIKPQKKTSVNMAKGAKRFPPPLPKS